MTYRAGVTASWTKPTEEWAGQLSAYRLRCSDAPIASSASQSAKDQWWQSARPVSLTGVTPSDTSPSAFLALRVAELNNCVVRVEDVAQQLGPIVQSTDLTLKLRQLVLSNAGTSQSLGYDVTPVGDVDNDGVEDVLVGGLGRAELVFGTTGALSAATKVVFTGSSGGVGRAVVGLGDFNGDGFNDFAIADPYWNGFTGRLSIYFGRPKAQWPPDTTINPLDIETACNADLCMEHAVSNAFMASTVASAGDFDGDGTPDVAIGAPYYPNFGGDGQFFVVLGATYEAHSCTTDDDCRTIESCVNSGCQLRAGEKFWKLQFELPSGNWTNPRSGSPIVQLTGFRLDAASGSALYLGTSIAGLGSFDSAAGQDLIVTAPGAGQIHYLSGRARSGTMGLHALAMSDLGLRSGGSGNPSGAPIVSGSAANFFGYLVAPLGNLYDVPGAAQSGIPDISISNSLTDEMYVQPADPLTTNNPFTAPLITIRGANSNIGIGVATGLYPTLGLLGDLDSDGRGDLLAGTRQSKDVVLWYADRFASSVASNALTRATGISITFQAVASDTAELMPRYVGDFNGDGFGDIVVGDQKANSNQGQAILLY
jgi:hypothetical protein